MSKLHKIFLFIVSLTGLGLSTGLFLLLYPTLYSSAPFVASRREPFLNVFPWDLTITVFVGYCIFMCLCFSTLLLIALFFPNKHGDLILVKDKGKLLFSKQTLVSTIRYSFADVDGINFSKVRVKINKQPEKTKIYVKLSLNDPSKLVDLTETVQNKIESTLNSSLGISVKSINIKVVEYNLDSGVRKENPVASTENSRVI